MGSQKSQKRVTTTGYAILGFIGIGTYSAYELKKFVERSLDWFWPRSGNVLYEVPKTLTALGLATPRERATGRRRRTEYTITPAGRRELQAWLDRRPEPPKLYFEALVKVLFSDQGDRDQLLATLEATRDAALDMLVFGRELGEEYRTTGGPFPDRLHVNALVFDFMYRYVEAIRAWTEWAINEVAAWDGARDQPERRAYLLRHYSQLTDQMAATLAPAPNQAPG